MAESTLGKPIFGLDIGSFSIKAAQIKYHGDRAELFAASIVDLPEPQMSLTQKDQPALIEALKKAVKLSKPHRIDTKYVASALPESKVYTDVITLPRLEEEELKTTIPLEAAKHMPLTPEESYLDYSIIEETKDKKIRVLVAGAPKDLVDFYRQIISQAGMELIHLEVKPISVARALLDNKMKQGAVLILDVGANNSSISIFLDGNIVVAITVSTGGELYVKAVAKELKISRNEALKMADFAAQGEEKKNKILRVLFPLFDDLVAKIQKAISYLAAKTPQKPTIDKILLTGGGAITPGFQEYLKQNIGLETSVANPFINLEGETAQKIPPAEACSIVTALGLALKR